MTEPYRVVVVEDDLDVAAYTKTVLEKRLGCEVRTYADPRVVKEAVAQFQPDVVITDIEMPGMSGLDLISLVREESPGIPIIVITAHVSVDYAVTALRNHANEFLTKPVSSSELVGHVERLGAEFRESKKNAGKRAVVLAIGAHPDDVEVGVGGILAAHREAGDSVTVLTLSRGGRDGGIRTAWEEGSAAAKLIGARLMLEDAAEHEIRREVAVEVIGKAVADIHPTIVYVHSKNDRHNDHRIVFDATVIAASRVPTIVCYQGSTATVDFRPNRFVNIDGAAETKVAMLECFAAKTERPTFLQPDFALATARYWSRFGQGTYCEPLEIVRESTEVG